MRLRFLASVLFSAAAIFSAAPSSAQRYRVLDVIGDSITIGVNPDFDHANNVHYGWVEMLFGEGGGEFPPPKDLTLDNLGTGIVRYNSSVKGSWGPQWADPASTLTQSVLDHHPDIVLIQLGFIDLFLYYQGDGVFTQEERETFANDLRAVIDRLQANTPRPDIVLLNAFDVFDGLSLQGVPANHEFHFMSRWAKEGNEIIDQVAREKGCYVVDVYNTMLHHCYGEDLGDPLYTEPSYVRKPLDGGFEPHPNTEGHSAIYEAVYACLEELSATSARPDVWTLY